ncbi:MAG: DUF2723 domain-containing protein [Alistipes sp.]|nr:DUF2723 domain-containing protein [Alistipes sp.]
MRLFTRWNNIVGWAVFAIAAATYLLTTEPAPSLWDCGEFIACAFKQEVGHPPGAPLFMLMARIASLLAPSTHYVPHAINAMNCIASAFCILFLFWTVTHIARKFFMRQGGELSPGDAATSIIAGAIGALAFTFTDTFWFSAVEGEVYALSSMFTALVVWLMLKWEDQADEPHAARWIILIAYLTGLSIGVHLLNLLTIPALVFIYYFRRTAHVTLRGVLLTTAVSFAILGAVYCLIIPYTVLIGAYVDLFFVNTLSLPVNSGLVFFVLLLIGLLSYGVWRTHRRGRPVWNMVLLSTLMIIVGYTSYAQVTIRAAANPPMNSNNPSTPFALLSFLNRDQYGNKPLLYGAYYSAPIEDVEFRDTYTYDDSLKRYVPRREMSNYIYADGFMHLMPRMWSRQRSESDYKAWAAYRTKIETLRDDDGEIMRDDDGRPVKGRVYDFGRTRFYDDGYEKRRITEPTFGENLRFFFSYQLNYMYWRYFLWNFVGRQNDIQADGATIIDGNWMSGIKAIDRLYIGPQENLPREVAGNRARNKYYFLPFLLGLIGMMWQLNRDRRNFTVVMWLFIMTGPALVAYFNTQPLEPRERDYVYAGSFYAFCMWIGLGAAALRELFFTLSKRQKGAIVAAAVVSLSVPCVLAAQNWDDHDRSHRTWARDLGWNFLQSTLPNSIILNYGDNDTFPLWLNQEIDGVRPDVKIMNTSYLGGDWYIDQMKTASNDSAPVPLSLPRSKYSGDTNNQIYILDRIQRPVTAKELMEFIISDHPNTKAELFRGEKSDYIPSRTIAIPVDKDNAIASGIVREQDRDLMVDTVYMNLKGNYLDKNELIIVDMLANFDWKRPIFFTQTFTVRNLGLLDYMQFDGFAYRLVPIYTPYDARYGDLGRVDPDYSAPLLRDVFRYGNVSDPRTYVDHFTQYNMSASHLRDGFARVASELARQGRSDEAVELLDLALEKLPTSQIRFSYYNTFPLIRAYYLAGADEKGDALLYEYMDNLIEYIEYYLTFEGVQADLVADALDDKVYMLDRLYYLAAASGRREAVERFNDYYRTFGATDDTLVDPSAGIDEAAGE